MDPYCTKNFNCTSSKTFYSPCDIYNPFDSQPFCHYPCKKEGCAMIHVDEAMECIVWSCTPNTPGPTPIPPPPPAPAPPSSKIVGISIGVPLTILTLILLLVWILCRYKRRRNFEMQRLANDPFSVADPSEPTNTPPHERTPILIARPSSQEEIELNILGN